MSNNISSWLNDSFDLNNTVVLTIRADGTIPVASARVSAWSNSACPTLPTLIKALDRTVVEMTQAKKHRATKFAAFLGGDKESDVAGHFHALLQFAPDIDQHDYIERFAARWQSKVSEAFKTHELRTSVYSEPLKNTVAYSSYCQRYEGPTIARDSKVVMSRSLRM